MARRRLSIPTAIIVAVVGVGASVGLVACDEDDDDPQECNVEGTCPTDGRVCLDEQTAAPCCPICPVLGNCPSGCILEFPPI